MNSRIKEAFDAVHTEEALKESTMAFLERRRKGGRARQGWWAGQRLAMAACALLLALGIGGWWLYFTPTATISIEINPYVELGINRFDRVVSAVGRNDDGEALVEDLHLRFLSYDQAVEAIVSDDTVASLLARDGVMVIEVIGADEAQCDRLLTRIQSCTAGQGNTYCYHASSQEAEEAASVGLSCGKYRAYLALKELDPTVTPEEIRAMSMAELRQRIADLSAGDSGSGTGTDTSADSSTSGSGASAGNGTAAGNGTSGGGQNGWGNHHSEEDGHGHHGGWDE